MTFNLIYFFEKKGGGFFYVFLALLIISPIFFNVPVVYSDVLDEGSVAAPETLVPDVTIAPTNPVADVFMTTTVDAILPAVDASSTSTSVATSTVDTTPTIDTISTSTSTEPTDSSSPAIASTSDSVLTATTTTVTTSQDTDTGKIVTISAPYEDPAAPLVDVIASTTIPHIYKVGEENKIHIRWKNNGNKEMSFHAYDTNADGYLDYVEWTVPHLSTQTFEIIFISKAFQLDQNQNIIADIYTQTQSQDGIYASVTDGEYVRVTFDQILNNTKDTTIYAQSADPTQQTMIEVYPVYTDSEGNMTDGPLVATFDSIDGAGWYRVLLTNLATPTDVFDLKIVGSVDIDYIVDPTGGGAGYYWVGGVFSSNTSDANNWSATPGACANNSGNVHVPNNTDDVHFGGTGYCQNSATVNSALSVYNMYMDPVYAGTVTQNASITTANSLIMASGTLAVGAQNLTVTASSTLTGGLLTMASSTGTGWTSAGIVIGTSSVVTSVGNSTITDSANWDSRGGTFNYGSSTLTMTGVATTTIYGQSGFGFNSLRISNNVNYQINNGGNSGSIYGTLTVDAGKTFSIGPDGTQILLLMNNNSVTTINGTIAGGSSARLYFYDTAINNLSTTGTITCQVFIDTISTNIVIPSRTFGYLVYLENSDVSAAHTATLGTAGGQTMNFLNYLSIRTLYSYPLTVDASVYNPTITIAGKLNFQSGGSNNSVLKFGSGNWTVGGNIDFSSGSIVAGSSTINLTAVTASSTITSNGQSFNNLRLSAGGIINTYTLQDPLSVLGNLTLATGTLSTTATSTSYAVTLAGNYIQASTSKFLASSSTITFNGNGTFTPDGTLDSTQFNNATLVMNGTSTINYSNLATNWVNGFYNFLAGQNGTTTIISNTFAVKNTLTIGPGTLTTSNAQSIWLNGASPLSLNANSRISLTTIYFAGSGNQTVPSMTNGYDSNIYIATTNVTQSGNVTLNSGKSLIVGANGSTVTDSWTTAGYNLTVGGNIQIGVGADTGLKQFFATNGVGGTSTITVAGNWLNYGNGAAPSQFIAGSSTVVFTGSASSTITTGSSTPTFNNITFNNAAGNWTLQDALAVTGNFTITNSEKVAVGVNLNNKNLTVGGDVLVASTSLLTAGTSNMTVAGNWSHVGSRSSLASSLLTMTGYNKNLLGLGGWYQPGNFGKVTIASSSRILGGSAGGDYTDGLLTVGGELVVSSGKIFGSATGGTINVQAGGLVSGAGDFQQLLGNSSIPLINSGTISTNFTYAFGGLTTSSIITATTFGGDLAIGLSNASPATTTLSAGTLNIAGNLNMYSSSNYQVTVDNTVNNTPIIIGGSVNIGTSTSATRTGFLKNNTAPITIGGNLTINAGAGKNALSTGSSTISVGGNWYNGDTFTAGSSTVVLTGTTTARTITSGSSTPAFNNLTLNSGSTIGAIYTLQDPLAVTGNLTLATGTLSTNSSSNFGVTLAGNYTQASTSKFAAGSSTITFNGNGTFTADGTQDSTQFNNATLVMNGTSTLAYTHSNASTGFNNLTVGQNGNTTTILGTMELYINSVLNVGSGTLTGLTASVGLYATNPLVFNSNSRISLGGGILLRLTGINMPALVNGYDSKIILAGYSQIATQVGNITLNSNNFLIINGNAVASRPATWKTAGYNLTVGGDIVIGNGLDTGLKQLDATRGVGGTSTITVKGNWLNYGNGTTPSQFIADNSTVIFNATTTGKTITSGSTTSPFNTVQFNGAGGAWTLQDNLTAASLTVATGTLIDNAKTVTVNGDISIANFLGALTSTGNWIQGASGTISNKNSSATGFKNLTIAGSGVTTTMNGSVYVTVGGTLTMGPGTLNGGGYQLLFYPSTNDALTVNSLNLGTSLSNLYIASNLGITEKAVTLPNNLGTIILRSSTASIVSTGDWNFGNNTIQIDAVQASTPTKYVDMGASALTAGLLSVGNNGAGYNGWLKLGSSLSNSFSSIAVTVGAGTSSILDFGSGATTVSGNISFTGILVTPGTATVYVTGTSSTQKLTSAGQSYYNLTQNGVGGKYTLQDALVVNHNLTLTAGTMAAAGNKVTIGGSLVGTTNLTATGTIEFTGTGSTDGALSTSNLIIDGAFTAGGPITVDTLTINPGGSLNMNGNLLNVNSTLTNSGTLTIGTNSTVNKTVNTGNIVTSGTYYFNATSTNAGTVTGNALFTASSTNYAGVTNGTVTANATFQSLTAVGGIVSFSGTTAFSGFGFVNTVSGNTYDSVGTQITSWVFNASSTNAGILKGTVIFNTTSSNTGTIQGNATFNNAATNSGTITGNVDVYSPVIRPLGGTINSQVTYHGYPGLYFSDAATGHGVAGKWDDLNNWWTDAATTIHSTVLPTSGDDVTILAGNITTTGITAFVHSVTLQGTATNGITLIVSATTTDAALFNASSTNTGTIIGNATFSGPDTSTEAGSVTGKITRLYSTGTFTVISDFTHNGGVWVIQAVNGAAVNLAGATYSLITNTFQALNNGFFSAWNVLIGGGSSATPVLTITSPISGTNIKWSPVVAWGTSYLCQYKIDSGSYAQADCSKNGSDIPRPTAASHTIYLKSTVAHGDLTEKSVSFTYDNTQPVDTDCTLPLDEATRPYYYLSTNAPSCSAVVSTTLVGNGYTVGSLTGSSTNIVLQNVIATGAVSRFATMTVASSSLRGTLDIVGNFGSDLASTFATTTVEAGGTVTGGTFIAALVNLVGGTVTTSQMTPVTVAGTMTNNGTVNGDITFNLNSINAGTVNGNLTLNGSAVNTGTLNGGLMFNTLTSNVGFVTFTGTTIFPGTGIVTGTIRDANSTPITRWIFTDTSSNIGYTRGNAFFNNSSTNTGTVVGNAYFNDTSSNVGSALVTGTADVYSATTAPLAGGGTVTGAITYHAYPNTISFANTAGDNSWSNPLNWYTDTTFALPLGRIPTTGEPVVLFATTTLPAEVTNTIYVAANNITLDGGGFTLNGAINASGAYGGHDGYSFTLQNITVTGTTTANGTDGVTGSTGGSITIATSTTNAIIANGGNGTTKGGNGGILTITNSFGNPADALLETNAGDATFCGNGGDAGSITLTDSTYTNTISNPGNGSNVGCPAQTHTNGSGSTVTVTGHYTSPTVSSGASNSTNARGGAGVSSGGVGFTVAELQTLLLKQLPSGALPVTSTKTFGITNFGNPLKGVQPLGALKVTALPVPAFDSYVETFLFAPLSVAALAEMKKSPQLLASVIASVPTNQALFDSRKKPVPLVAPKKTPPGLYRVTDARTGKELPLFVTSVSNTSVDMLVRVTPGEQLSINVLPISVSAVQVTIQGKVIPFTPVEIAWAATTTPGRYTLSTTASPMILIIEVAAPLGSPAVPAGKAATPVAPAKKASSGWFSWVKALF